ncbi:MAG: hypothetical protein WBX81_04225 [Nitrososphaeraceae archaeon]
MRTHIDVERNIWGKVKDFATVRKLSLSSAVHLLLQQGLTDSGHSLENGGEKNGN